MNAFAHLFANDIRTLYRSGYVWVSVAVFVLMLLVALQASRLDFAGYESFMAALILFDAVLSPLMLVGLMVLLERGEGAFVVLCVSPARTWTYMTARVLSVSLISIAQMLVLVVSVYDAALSPLALTAGLAAACCISALCGFALVAHFDDLYAYLLPMMGAILVLGVPGYAVLLAIAPGWLFWHPTAGPLALIERSFDLEATQALGFASGSALLWISGTASLAYRAVRRMQARIGGF